MTEIYHVIKDPVHGSMQFTTEEDSWIKPFIDTENFQRLRHIKQLGMADLIFPGATHNRFSHALGCCYIASQISNKLKLPRAKKRIVMMAALLHDIGHGPFSHAFESLFADNFVHHEDWTRYFLQDYYEQKILDKSSMLAISKLIEKKEIEDLLLADIVSSQLDADRLDYLLRDSHFCGVNYGEYDLRWLLHCLTIIEKNGKKRLGITPKGIGTVEHYLMARRLMVRNVYQNEKKHGAEFLLQMFLKYLVAAIVDKNLFPELKTNVAVKFLINVAEFNSKRKPLKNKSEFLKANFELYKQLYDYDILALIRSVAHSNVNHDVVEIAKRIQVRKNPKVRKIATKEVVGLRKKIKKSKAKDWQLSLITLPHLSYEINSDPILIQNKDGKITQLHNESLIVKSISDKIESINLLFVDPEIFFGK